MEKQKKNCSSKDHENIEAIIYCQQCQIYMCKKCDNIHSKLCQHHHPYNLDKDSEDIFTGICKVQNHSVKLNYFCKNHNQLCCAECITKIKDKENGQHNDCNICSIEDIKDKKKDNLNKNIQILEEISKNIEQSISDLTKLFLRINQNKENLKLDVQKIFTQLRTEINQREDELLLEIDQKFDDLFFKEDLIKESNMLPNKIKFSLEKGKNINNDWNNENKLNLLINDYINIEKNIEYIININNNLNKCKYMNSDVKFNPSKDSLKELTKKIKEFGHIYYDNLKFKQCPKKIKKDRIYNVNGEKGNILTKIGNNYNWMGTICENILDKSKEYYWKIKILKTYNHNIMVEVAPIDFDINNSLYNNYGWYYNLNDSSLYSGPPYYYPKNNNDKKKEKINYYDEKKECEEKYDYYDKEAEENYYEKEDYEEKYESEEKYYEEKCDEKEYCDYEKKEDEKYYDKEEKEEDKNIKDEIIVNIFRKNNIKIHRK